MPEKKENNRAYSKCLLPLLDAIGWHGETRFVHEAMPVDMSTNDSLDNFLACMANLGYFSTRSKYSLRKLPSELLPSLFVGKDGVPKVLLRTDADGVFAYHGGDSKYEVLSNSRSKGTLYVFNEITKETKTLMDQQPFWFMNLVARFKVPFTAFVTVSFLLSVLMVISPLFIMFVYDQIKYKSDTASLAMLGGAVAIYVVAFTAAVYMQSSILRFVSSRIGNIVSNQVVRRVLLLPLSFTEITSLASHMARLKDFINIQNFFGGAPFAALCEIPFTAILLLVLYLLGGGIVAIPICAMLVFAVFYMVVKGIVSKLNVSIAGVGSKKQELLLEILTCYPAIKHSGRRKFWEERFYKLSADWALQKFKNAKMNGVISVFSTLLVSLAALGTIYLGVLKVLNNEMSPGGLMATMILVWRILGPIKNGFAVLSQTASVRKSVSQLDRLMNMPLDVNRQEKETMTRKLRGDLNISQLYLRYLPDAEPAIAGVEFAISRGETLVVCGHEGSGKSTLLKLLTSLYPFQAGHIVLDNINIKQMQPATLRKSITFLPQHIQLFSGTLESNLKAFNPAATMAEMENALRMVGLDEDIAAFPAGLKTRVDESNKNKFQPDFRKLFFLAAALLRNTGVMIMDEGTKGIGKERLVKVMELFKELKATKTFVFVSDQYPVFEIADKVLWLDKGRVRKFGDRDEVAKEYFESGG
jgi:ATP-binding cassette subfamily C protein/ATP-binding cassette subfamily C protein LapB